MKTVRYHYIDFLRVIAILMMFLFHVSMVFVAEWNWHIKNEETSNVLLELNYWMSSFRMPLLFFVSGFISYVLMSRMSWKSFSVQRFKRLIIPTIIWTFILVAPQLYFERKLEGADQSYVEFYASFLQFEWWPEGNFHWLHLWFIPYLFCYNLLSIPLFYLLQRNNSLTGVLDLFFQKRMALFLFVGIAILPYTFLSVHYDASYDLINDIARHSFFIFFIIAGLLFFRFNQILEIIQTDRRLFLSLAFLSIVTINIIRWNGWEPYGLWDNWIEKPQTYLYNALLNFNTWMWVFTSLGYGKQYLNRGSRILTYANTAVYPFYILHQTVIVIIAFYVVQTNDEASLKFLFLLFACFFITILIYHLFIRPFNIMRFLFGMKYSNLFFSVSLLLSLLLISCGTTNDAQKSSATVEATHEKTVEATVYDNTQASWEYLFSKVPGVDYTRGGLKIRGGSNSIGGGSDDPLIVVDGTVGSLEGLNPTDVDRIRVLKGPQAAIYGSRAAAGVIEITTKKQ